MKSCRSTIANDDDAPLYGPNGPEEAAEEDLWFLPGPLEEEPDYLIPGPRAAASASEAALIDEWVQAEAGSAARLARVAGRLGALEDRLRRGPDGWRHRLALVEAAELGWFTGERVSSDRLALWLSMRLTGAQDDPEVLARAGWAVRRLRGGPGPMAGLSAFLDRRDPRTIDGDADRFDDRASGWLEMMTAAVALHPITRACMGFHLWRLAGLELQGQPLEAAVTAARIAFYDDDSFAPLAMGGAGGLRAGGPPPARLARWLEGMEAACLTAMRHLDDIEAWTARATAEMAGLSGKTPPLLRAVLAEWPLVSAPMVEALTGASRAAIQRNLGWMETKGLIREVTGQGRFRMWRVLP